MAKLKESAVSYAERVDKPILILHGMDDYRTPIEGAHQFYVAIKDLHPDLPVKMVAYPHTGHEQPTDPRLLKHYYHEMILWFEKYLVKRKARIMKIYAFGVRDDEKQAFEQISAQCGVEVTLSDETPSLENADLVKGYEGVTALGMGNIDRDLLSRYSENGVRFLSTRTIGYNHIDLVAAKELGIKVCNAAYPPNGVADFTVMMIFNVPSPV